MYLHCFHINQNNLEYKVMEENAYKVEVLTWKKKKKQTQNFCRHFDKCCKHVSAWNIQTFASRGGWAERRSKQANMQEFYKTLMKVFGQVKASYFQGQ